MGNKTEFEKGVWFVADEVRPAGYSKESSLNMTNTVECILHTCDSTMVAAGSWHKQSACMAQTVTHILDFLHAVDLRCPTVCAYARQCSKCCTFTMEQLLSITATDYNNCSQCCTSTHAEVGAAQASIAAYGKSRNTIQTPALHAAGLLRHRSQGQCV